jgi:hypothetical protein
VAGDVDDVDSFERVERGCYNDASNVVHWDGVDCVDDARTGV